MDTTAPRRVGKSRRAWETGVRFYDTAPWYGLGRSERRLGLALTGLASGEPFRVNTVPGDSWARFKEEDLLDEHAPTP